MQARVRAGQWAEKRRTQYAGRRCSAEMPVPAPRAPLIKHLLCAAFLPDSREMGHRASSLLWSPNTRAHTLTGEGIQIIWIQPPSWILVPREAEDESDDPKHNPLTAPQGMGRSARSRRKDSVNGNTLPIPPTRASPLSAAGWSSERWQPAGLNLSD